MKKIFSLDSLKGGTGKSLVGTAIVDVALSAGKKVLIVEADMSNPVLGKIYADQEVYSTELLVKEDFIELATVIQGTEAEIIVINNAAVHEWEKYSRYITNNIGEFGAAELNVFWIANAEKDVLEKCVDFYEKCPAAKMHFCMNEHFAGRRGFDLWKNSKIRTKILENGGSELTFPDIATRVAGEIRNRRLPWSKVEELDFGDRIEAVEIRNEFHEILAPYINN